MTPDEIFNQQVWEILQDIKEEFLATVKGKPVKYRIPNVIGVGIIPPDRRRKILYKLEEEKAFKIQRNSEGVRIGTGDIFYLIINPSKFDEVYKEHSSIFLKPDNKVVAPNYGKGGVSVEVLISDLQAKYLEIQNEKNDSKFYLKIASYGNYLNDHDALYPIISQLHDESQIQIANFKKAWSEFFEKWRVLAKDLIETADAVGVKDEGPLQNEIEEVRAFLDQPDPQFNDDEPPHYFRSYREIILRFNKLGKASVISKKHLDDDGSIKLYLEFNKVEVEWDKFKKVKEISTWWAHYQISRLAGGVLGSEEEKNRYLNNNNIVDQLYKHEFEEISRGTTSTLVILKRPKFEEWITRLHNYLIPRLKELPNEHGTDLKRRYNQLLEEIKSSSENQASELKKRYEKTLTELTTQNANLPKSVTTDLTSTVVTYNSLSHTILFAKREIPIPPDTDQDSLCKIIFKNEQTKRKEWSWDEMLEKWGGHYEDKESWRKVYNAGREVNQKVAIETTVKDLLLVRKRSVTINPKHLK